VTQQDHAGAWDQIGGLTDAKERLMKGIVWPIQHGNALERLGLGAPKGIIIEGPPGNYISDKLCALYNVYLLPNF